MRHNSFVGQITQLCKVVAKKPCKKKPEKANMQKRSIYTYIYIYI